MNKSKLESLIAFHGKQLQDREGIIRRSAELDPDNPEWLVLDIEAKISKYKKELEALNERGN